MNNRRENTSPFSSDLVVVGGLGVVLIRALLFYGGVQGWRVQGAGLVLQQKEGRDVPSQEQGRTTTLFGFQIFHKNLQP